MYIREIILSFFFEGNKDTTKSGLHNTFHNNVDNNVSYYEVEVISTMYNL